MLVDDEEWNLEGLAQVVRWEEHGFRVECAAGNGREALRLLRSHSIDVVVTDIRMPFVDGLELIRTIAAEYSGIKTVILSGYGDFEYARQAIQYGAVGYLLKPTQQDELQALLARIKDQLDEARELRADAGQVRKFAETQIKYNLESALRELALYGGKEHVAAVESRVPAGRYGICLIKDFREENMAVFAKLLGERELKRYFPPDWTCLVLKYDGFVLLFLAAGAGESDNDLRATLGQILASVRETGKVLSYKPVLFATAAFPFADLEEAHRIYKLSLERLRCTFQAEDGIIPVAVGAGARSDAGVQEAEAPGGAEPESFAARILLADKPEVVQQLVDGFIARLKQGSPTASDVRGAVVRLAAALRKALDDQIDEPYRGEPFDTDKLNEIYTFDQLEPYLKGSVYHFIEILQKYQINYFTRLIYIVYEYVDTHYRDAIKLDDVARAVNLSTTYFCYVFKKETGMTFMDYLIKYRLEKSKRLLAETDLKLYEVAELVGYRDVRHYMKQFKRMYRKRPGEFRRE